MKMCPPKSSSSDQQPGKRMEEESSVGGGCTCINMMWTHQRVQSVLKHRSHVDSTSIHVDSMYHLHIDRICTHRDSTCRIDLNGIASA